MNEPLYISCVSYKGQNNVQFVFCHDRNECQQLAEDLENANSVDSISDQGMASICLTYAQGNIFFIVIKLQL